MYGFFLLAPFLYFYNGSLNERKSKAIALECEKLKALGARDVNTTRNPKP